MNPRFDDIRTPQGIILLCLCLFGMYKTSSVLYHNYRLSGDTLQTISQPIMHFEAVTFSKNSDNFRHVKARFYAENGRGYTCETRIFASDMVTIQQNNNIANITYVKSNPNICMVEGYKVPSYFMIAIFLLSFCYFYFGNYILFRNK